MFRSIALRRRLAGIGIVAVAGLVTGCGITSSIGLDVVAAKSIVFDFRDERPAVDPNSHKTAPSLGSEITAIGDDDIQPGPVALFQTWFNKLPAERPTCKMVELQMFRIEVWEPNLI